MSIIYDKDLNSGQDCYMSKDHSQLYKNLLEDPIPLLVQDNCEDEEGWEIESFFPEAYEIATIKLSNDFHIPSFTIGSFKMHMVSHKVNILGIEQEIKLVAYSEQNASPLSVFVSLEALMYLKQLGVEVNEPDWCV